MRLADILIAPDSFKGSLSARQCAEAMRQGVADVDMSIRPVLHPVSDGGEGFVDVLTGALGGAVERATVAGPLPGQEVIAFWGWVADRHAAIIEMAEAAGHSLVPEDRRDPLGTTTYGVGQIVKIALDYGARTLVIGLGGSATNDGGAGLAEALGVRLLDSTGKAIAKGGGALAALDRMDLGGLDPRLREAEIIAACDVQNPLLGPAGASAVYGPQKGATPEMVKQLDGALGRWADVLLGATGRNVRELPGAGAAGGLGAALFALCGARIEPGIDVVLDMTAFDARLQGVDLVLTGEGRLDAQTRFGKTISGVLARAARKGVPVAAVVGSIEGSSSAVEGEFAGLATLVDAETSGREAMRNAALLVRQRTVSLLRRLAAR